MNSTTQTTESRQRLTMSPVMWVALSIVLLLGVRSALKPVGNAGAASESQFSVLNFLGDDRRVPVRSSDPVQVFETLGVRVRVADGWTYLATKSSDRTIRPTFVHVPSGATVQLFPMPKLPEGADVLSGGGSGQVPSGQVQWVSIGQTIRIDAPDGDRGTIPLAWHSGDPRRIGRWIGPSAGGGWIQIGLVAIDGGHGHAAADPAKMVAQAAIESFCAGIEATKTVR